MLANSQIGFPFLPPTNIRLALLSHTADVACVPGSGKNGLVHVISQEILMKWEFFFAIKDNNKEYLLHAVYIGVDIPKGKMAFPFARYFLLCRRITLSLVNKLKPRGFPPTYHVQAKILLYYFLCM